MPPCPPIVDRVNADTSGGGQAATGSVLGGTARDGWGRAAAYDAYADGLHTYALWYLRDHDAAADAAYCAFVAADRNHTNLQQPEQIQPWLYALLRRECRLRASEGPDAPMPVSGRLRPKPDAPGEGESGVSASFMQLERNLRRAEFQSLAWPEAEGLAPAHREVLELTIRHGLDSRGLALVLGLREASAGLAPTRGFGLLADAWRELERSLAAAAVAASGRENCAQLAELTFGWSGRLNATLRAPLTEHVDGCSRCQHYLHTVIGTPSAPTILPFVAAPRALREILLGELSDLDAASDAGIDLHELGARCGTFGPEGFPLRFDPPQQGSGTANTAGAGRGPRRGGRHQQQHQQQQPSPAQRTRPQRTAAAPAVTVRPQPVYKSSDSGRQPPVSDMRRRPASNQPTNVVDVTTARPASQVRPRASETDDLFWTKGSWADKVLPSEAGSPADAVNAAIAANAAAAAGAAESTGETEFWRPRPETRFIETSSGRFATRLPVVPSAPGAQAAPAHAPSGPDASDAERRRSTGASTAAAAPARGAGTAQLPRFARAGRNAPSAAASATSAGPQSPANRANPAAPATRRPSPGYASPSGPAGPSSGPSGRPSGSSSSSGPAGPSSSGPAGPATARPRHKARPMRQAVVSAMALGAIGAVAAAAAAMLGVSANPHNSASGGGTALDGSQSADGLGSASSTGPANSADPGKLSVSVTTGAAGSPTGGGLLTGASGLAVGLPSASATGSGAAGGAPASPPPTSASAGAFYVSVNQRSADPNSVQILLRNTGTGSLSWSAASSVPWLALSQSSGTLAAGQSLVVTASATSAAPTGQWAARIVFSPGGIVVTLHGGVPVSTDPTTPSSGGGSTASSDPTTPPPTTSAPTTPSSPPTTTASTPPSTGTSGGGGGGSTSGEPTSSGPTSGSQAPTPTGTAASNPPSTSPA